MEPADNPAVKYQKVLVIDDTYLDRYVAERVLRRNNVAAEVVCIESAQSGLIYLKDCLEGNISLPDLIFLDIRMPEMDGFAFLDAYRELPEQIIRHCIIMILSTSLDPEDHKKAGDNPLVKKFLNKPLSREVLQSI
jgi:CheY-like chemotaxis protein